MIIVTTDTIEGRDVIEVLGLVRGSSVRARHVGRDVMAAGLPFFAVETLPDVGHFPHEEAPAEVVYALRLLALVADHLAFQFGLIHR